MKSLDPQVVAAAIPSIIHALLPVIRDWDTEKRVGGTNALNRGVRYKWRIPTMAWSDFTANHLGAFPVYGSFHDRVIFAGGQVCPRFGTSLLVASSGVHAFVLPRVHR